jgi:uncharacterized protein
MLKIDLQTARRFILGRQGLWPGRRWRGSDGAAQAMRQMEYLQLDPLQIIARSQDIQLHSRVLDYTPGLWQEPAYGQRQFFDWGGWLAVRPMDELPHWRVVMLGEKQTNSRLHSIAQVHADAVEEMRQLLKEHGTVSNRSFEMAKRTRTNSYRGRKDSSLALYYLWITGEVMIHHRENFERVYALTGAVAPEHLIRESEESEALRFLVKKEVSFAGLSRLKLISESFYRGVARTQAPSLMETLLEEGELIPVHVEGWKQVHCALAEDLPLLEELSAGGVPAAWKPLGPNTLEEAVFLAPLDPVSARGRAKVLFDFDYVWEVYKPQHLRRFGYYVLPVLWGDRLAARFDSKLDRTSGTFIILGFWLEDDTLAENEAFAAALAKAFARFTTFLGVSRLDAAGIAE